MTKVFEEKFTVFYDGACPLCQREISYYRRQQGADSVHWRDISNTTEDQIAPDLARSQALSRFYVRRVDGKLVSGVSAFAHLWLLLPAFHVWGKAIQVGPVLWALEHCYDLFLKIRPVLHVVLGKRSITRQKAEQGNS